MNLVKASEVAKEHRKQYITLDNGEKIKWDDNTDVKVWVDDNGVPINQQQYDELKRQAAENQWSSTADANSLINQEVKQRAADRESDARTPGIGTIMTQPLQVMAPAAPSNLFGTAMGIYRGDNFNTVVNKLFGENNTGFLEATEGTKKWAKEHPWSTLAINLAGDIAAPVAGIKTGTGLAKVGEYAANRVISNAMDNALKSADISKVTSLTSPKVLDAQLIRTNPVKNTSPVWGMDYAKNGMRDINQLVSESGDVNIDVLTKLLKDTELGDLSKVKLKAKRHKSDLAKYGNGENNDHVNVLNHMKAVAESALKFPLPAGANRQEFVTAALLHDLGKIITTDEVLHGPEGARLVKQLFKNVPESVTTAIDKHMGRSFNSPLEKAIHTVDVANGRPSLASTLEEFPKSRLKYPSHEAIYPDISHGEPITPKAAAVKAKLIPKPVIKNAEYGFMLNEDGSYKMAYMDNGKPLVNYNGEIIPYQKVVDELIPKIRKEGNVTASGILRVDPTNGKTGYLSTVPIYDHTIFDKALKSISSQDMLQLRHAAFVEKDPNAVHVLANLKYLEKHPLEGIESIGGKTHGTGELRFTPGQLSDVVDLYKSGYRGTISPVLKGSGNTMTRSKGFLVSTNHDFGGKMYTTNSPKVALRYADIKHFTRGENREMLLEGLTTEQKRRANAIMDDILAFNEKYGIKQGTTKSSEGYTAKGTYEDLPLEIYEHPEILEELLKKYDALQHVLGNKNLQVGGVRRGIITVKPNIVGANWLGKTYRGWLPKDHPLYKYYRGGDHNSYTEFLSLMKINLGMTENIGESLLESKVNHTPYGIDFLTQPQDFIISRWKRGGTIKPASKLIKK